MMVGHGLLLIVTGLGIGVAGAGLLSRTLQTLLVGVSPTDPITFLFVAALFLAVAIAAAGVPAWRASRLDPTTALRQE
jgi:ABC-type antimicrobial peptide transport system permease subunit